MGLWGSFQVVGRNSLQEVDLQGSCETSSRQYWGHEKVDQCTIWKNFSVWVPSILSNVSIPWNILITEVRWTSPKSNPNLSSEVWATSCKASSETYGMDLTCLPLASCSYRIDTRSIVLIIHPAHISGKKELSLRASSTDEKACQWGGFVD